MASSSSRTVITFGTYDIFHYGHLRILERSAALGDRLVVGVSSDALNWHKKQKKPAISETQRMAIVASLKCVDEVFLEESLELKKEYCIRYGADVLVMGDDHLNEYDKMLEGVCECHYLPRTKGVSSTDLKRQISSDSICSADWGSSPPDAIPLIKNMSYNSLASIGEDEDGSSSDETDKEASPLLSAIPDPTPDVAKVEETKEQKMPEESVQQPAKDAYSAANKNLVHSTEQTNPVTAFLVDAHDRYYQWVMDTCTPFCAIMPREVTVGGRTVTIFTANIVTYARGFLAIPIVLGMKYGWLWTASFLVMYHDFLDHLDGVVAKQQAKDGRSKGDDGMWGAFLDAQMDKLVFCQLLWSFVMMMDYCSWTADLLVVLTCTLLFGLEFTIGAVRTQDYFQAKYQPATSGGRALRAVSEGKLKQKFESTGIAFYCLALPDPASNMLATFLGTTCLWFAAYYSLQSLMHKLNARAKCE